MITLSAATGTGFFTVTHGKQAVISSTGPWSPNTRLASSYSFSGATSGLWAGFGELRKGNFQQELLLPGPNLKFELSGVDGYTSINIEVKETP